VAFFFPVALDDHDVGARPTLGANDQFFLIVEMANAGDMRCVAVLLRPVDGVSLGFERLEYVVGVIFDYIIVNVATFGAALRSGLNINCRHTHSSFLGRSFP